MLRNPQEGGVVPKVALTNGEGYMLWNDPVESARDIDPDINFQYFNTDNGFYQNGDDFVDTNVVDGEPFSADDLIDSCLNRGRGTTSFAIPVQSEVSAATLPLDNDQYVVETNDSQVDVEMSRDPTILIQTISSLLDDAGGVKDMDSTFVSIMENATIMPMQCLLINVLRSTNKNTVKRLLSDGVWSILYEWLSEARKQINKPFLLEILQLYKVLPINTKLLKSNSCAKEIKQLIKNPDERVSRYARVIVDDWMKVVSGATASTNTSSKTFGTQKKAESAPTDEHKSNAPHESEKQAAESTQSTDKNEALIRALSVSVQEKKPRPKTVKTLPNKFRSTGLEEVSNDVQNYPKAQPRQIEKIALKKSATFSTLPAPAAVASRPQSSSSFKTPKVKIIPARPMVVPEVSEKSLFLDALNTATVTTIRKRKKVVQAPAPPQSLSAPTISAAQDLSKEEIAEALKGSPRISSSSSIDGLEAETPVDDNELSAKKPRLEVTGKLKKSVSWASEKDLCDYFYFEIDPDERTNVNKPNQSANFMDHRRQEREMERQAILGMSHSKSKCTTLMEWKCPPLIDGIELMCTVQLGGESKEKAVQAEREARVLHTIYFNPMSIPDSPTEPEEDMVSVGQEECRIIPLEDVEDEPMETELSAPQIPNLMETSIATPPPPSSLPSVLTNLFGSFMNQPQLPHQNADSQKPYSSPTADFGRTPPNNKNPSPPQCNQLYDDQYSYHSNPPFPNQPDQTLRPHSQTSRDGSNQFDEMNHRGERFQQFTTNEEPPNNFRPRGPPPQHFGQSDFRGRNPGPRHTGESRIKEKHKESKRRSKRSREK